MESRLVKKLKLCNRYFYTNQITPSFTLVSLGEQGSHYEVRLSDASDTCH